jgi:hypothetical protein
MLSLLLIAALPAQLPVVVEVPGPGRYVLALTVAPDGTAQVQQLPVHKLDGTPTDPIDPIDPIDPATGLQAEVKKLTMAAYAGGGGPLTGTALARLHQEVGERWAAGSLTEAQALRAIDAGTKLIFRKVSDADKWAAWAAGTEALRTRERQKGTFAAQTLLDISAGANAATSQLRLFENIDFERLIELVLLIIKLISGLGI